MILPLLLAAALPFQEPAPLGSRGPARVRNVAILVYPGVELLDFAGPGEVFSAVRVAGDAPFRAYTVATTTDTLRSQGFVDVTPEYSIADCPAPDVVVVPGGGVPLSDAALRAWVREVSASAEVVMSVCNGALLLAAEGLLAGLEITTHHGSLLTLAAMEPTARVLVNRRFVDHGRVVTCAGVSAGIDGSLQVVRRLVGEEAARETARYMEYDWRPEELAELHAAPGEPVAGAAGYALLGRIEADGIAATAAAMRALDEGERPGERALNSAGYARLARGDVEGAVDVFRLVCELHPASANACDSLSEALERAGRLEESLAWAEKSAERLDGREGDRLRNAVVSRIARLKGEEGALRFVCPPCGRPCDESRYANEGRCPSCSMTLVEVYDPE